MQIHSQPFLPHTPSPTLRKDPAAFVLSIALGLFGLTLLSVVLTQLATQYGWQIL